MVNVAVVYFSGQGHTHQMAEALAAGAEEVEGTRAQCLRITGKQIQDGRWKDDAILTALNEANAIAFGSPTYMGGVSGQFKCFIDAASEIWFQQGWKDKIAGGFTHSGSPSGDKQGTLLYMAINATQHGMIWVGFPDFPSEYQGKDDGVNRLGSFMGVMGRSMPDMSGGPANVHPGDLKTARLYGQRLANVAHRWSS